MDRQAAPQHEGMRRDGRAGDLHRTWGAGSSGRGAIRTAVRRERGLRRRCRRACSRSPAGRPFGPPPCAAAGACPADAQYGDAGSLGHAQESRSSATQGPVARSFTGHGAPMGATASQAAGSGNVTVTSGRVNRPGGTKSTPSSNHLNAPGPVRTVTWRSSCSDHDFGLKLVVSRRVDPGAVGNTGHSRAARRARSSPRSAGWRRDGDPPLRPVRSR